MNERERGAVGAAAAWIIVGVIIGIVVIIGALFGACDAIFEDPDEENDLGAPALVLDHDGDEYDQWRNEDHNRNRNRNRGAFSPGPFDDSPVDAGNNNTICLPGATCTVDGRRGEREPA